MSHSAIPSLHSLVPRFPAKMVSRSRKSQIKKKTSLVEKSAHKLGAICAVVRKSVQKILIILDCSAFNRMLLLKHETYVEDADLQTVEKE